MWVFGATHAHIFPAHHSCGAQWRWAWLKYRFINLYRSAHLNDNVGIINRYQWPLGVIE